MRHLDAWVLGSLVLAGMSPGVAGATPPEDEARVVRINQTATRTVGRCTYTATLRGSYVAEPSTPVRVRDAMIDVEARLVCPGRAPVVEAHQLYFAGATETELLGRLAEAARVRQPLRGGEPCAYSPSFQRSGGTLRVTEVVTSCPEPVARGGGPTTRRPNR